MLRRTFEIHAKRINVLDHTSHAVRGISVGFKDLCDPYIEILKQGNPPSSLFQTRHVAFIELTTSSANAQNCRISDAAKCLDVKHEPRSCHGDKELQGSYSNSGKAPCHIILTVKSRAVLTSNHTEDHGRSTSTHSIIVLAR